MTNPNVKTNTDGSVDIALSRPVMINGVPVSAFRMREPLVNDQLVMDATGGTPANQEITIFANLCGYAPDDLKQLPLKDYKRLQQAFSLFID